MQSNAKQCKAEQRKAMQSNAIKAKQCIAMQSRAMQSNLALQTPETVTCDTFSHLSQTPETVTCDTLSLRPPAPRNRYM
jgi:hypothetical protein